MTGFLITIAIIQTLGLGFSISKHGEPAKPVNAWVSLMGIGLFWFIAFLFGVI